MTEGIIMVRVKAKLVHYMALVGCESADAGRFEPGDSVPLGAFPAGVVKEFIEQGVLAEVRDDGDGQD